MHDGYICKNSLSWKHKTCEYCMYTISQEKNYQNETNIFKYKSSLSYPNDCLTRV